MARDMDRESKEDKERFEAFMDKIENDDTYPDVAPPADFHEKLAKQIAEFKEQQAQEEKARVLLSDEDKEALKIGREILEKQRQRATPFRRRQRKVYLLVAAVTVLTLAFGVVGVGARGNIVEFLSYLFGDATREVVETSGEDKIDTEISEDEKAYEEIAELFGESVIKINLTQKKLEFSDVKIDASLERVDLKYNLQDEICYYHIYRNSSNNSHSLVGDDEAVEFFEIKHKKMVFMVTGVENRETGEIEYMTVFEYNNLSYVLRGSVSREDFEEILTNLIFF